MDVNKANAVTPAGPGGPKQEQKRGADDEKQENEHRTNGDDAVSPWEGTEAFAVDGILAGDLSPEVQKAFEGLARQFEPLRAEVERARGREAHFRELAEKHSFLPLPGRREFFRELAHVINNMEHLSPPPSLVVLHIVNADDVRRRFGRRALDGALIHVSAVIEASLHPTDVAGSFGGNDFGIMLLVANEDLARTKARGLVEAIAEKPLPWQGVTIALEARAGVATLKGATTPEDAMELADRDLVAGSGAPAKQTGTPTAEG
ncbi:MAG: GGDEF domain-containing protein [Rhodospirillales bacterium]